MFLRCALTSLSFVALLCTSLTASSRPNDDRTFQSQSGGELYRAACSSCHGPDGKGLPATIVGFDTPVPDFTDCSFATPEPDADWIAVVHEGGPARAFDRRMPAFGDALSEDQIRQILDHIRGFCEEPSWPRGELNLPRPLVTEKAFPENELVVSLDGALSGASAISNELVYERRLGPRGQYEVVVPLSFNDTEGQGGWSRGLGDIAVAFKYAALHSLSRGSILSIGSELVFPTGKESEGLGGGATVFEPFVAFGQILPRDGFLHLHAGVEIPSGPDHDNEVFWRAALGKTLTQGRSGRAWSPMIEVGGARELASGTRAEWDIVPQMQVTLSRRQHIMLNAGVRVPVTDRTDRQSRLLMYLLWDWFDGAFFDGW